MAMPGGLLKSWIKMNTRLNFRLSFKQYTHEHLKLDDSRFMKQNADFKDSISQVISTSTPLPTPKFLTTNQSFEMRYYIRIFLKGHEMGKIIRSEKCSFY